MMNRKIFVGIDGGGTHTTAVAFDEEGRFVALQTGDSVNFCSLGMEKAKKNMREIISALYEKVGTSRFYSVFIGMSAIEDKATDEQLSAFCPEIINSEFIAMNSDLYAALEGMCTNEPCVFAVSGTGSMVIAKDNSGKIFTSGGWGYLLGDEGSGYDIAMKGIKAAVRAVDPGINETALTNAMFRFFGADSLSALTRKFYNPPMERSTVASFCSEVCVCAENGDNTALAILRESAQQLAMNANLLIDKTDSDTVGIYGGVFKHSPLFVKLFSSFIKGTATVVFPPFAPHVGAAIASYKNAGAFSDKILYNIKNTFSDGK